MLNQVHSVSTQVHLMLNQVQLVLIQAHQTLIRVHPVRIRAVTATSSLFLIRTNTSKLRHLPNLEQPADMH
jgi:hypothetical protein